MHIFLIALVAVGVAVLGSVVIYIFFSRTTSTAAGVSDGTGLFLFERGDKYGFRDINEHIVINPKFDEAQAFSEGLAVIKKNGKWGYINPQGKLALGWFDEPCGDFSHGLAPRRVNKQYGYINPQGEFVIPSRWDSAGHFSEGLAVVSTEGKFGLIDEEGKQVVKPEMDEINPVNEGLATARQGEKWGVLKADGNWLVFPRFISMTEFVHGESVVQEKIQQDFREGVLNRNGEIEWNDNLNALNEFNRKKRRLEDATHKLINSYLEKGCPCRYPRYRRVVQFQGAAVTCFETNLLVKASRKFLVPDSDKKVEKGDSITQGYFTCPKCASQWRKGRETYAGDGESLYLVLEVETEKAPLGKDVVQPFPLYLGFEGPSTMDEEVDEFRKVRLDEYISYMQEPAS